MAFPQGINYRETLAYSTDESPNDGELGPGQSFNSTYPRTTAQGNTVGWIIPVAGGNSRNRSATNEFRLRGMHFHDWATNYYRIDLPNPGKYRVALACGDQNYVTNCGVDLYDDTTNLVTLAAGTTSAPNRFWDATGVERTNANWAANNAKREVTLTSSVMRLYKPAAVTYQAMVHFYVESAGGPPPHARDFSSFYPIYHRIHHPR